jgi:hypothetical protein
VHANFVRQSGLATQGIYDRILSEFTMQLVQGGDVEYNHVSEKQDPVNCTREHISGTTNGLGFRNRLSHCYIVNQDSVLWS